MFPASHHSWSLEMTPKDPAKVEAGHSEPWNKPTLRAQKPGLERIQTIQNCIQLLTDLAKEVEDISQPGRGGLLGNSKGETSKPAVSVSVQQSKSLILQWAEEVNSLKQFQGSKRKETGREKRDFVKAYYSKDRQSQRIQEWARELQSVSEACSLTDADLRDILSSEGVNRKKLAGIMPFLEFVAWCLLSRDTEEGISKLWLPAKQRTWKTGTQKYIPHSVWQWIQSASVAVRMDPTTSYPWLCISEDNLTVMMGAQATAMQHSHQFDKSPCVLGLPGFSSGQQYWEVEVPISGGWKVGVTTACASRKGRFRMSPAQGYWTIWCSAQNLWASSDPDTALPNSAKPQVVGIYLDYEEGQVSFYDAGNRSHIFTFTDTFKKGLLPVFACLDANAVLKIRPSGTVINSVVN